MESQNIHEIVSQLETVQLIRYLGVVGLSLIIWDSILIAQLEFERIWRSSPVWLRVAYAVNRYSILAVAMVLVIGVQPPGFLVMDSHKCKAILYFATLGASFGDLVANGLTVVRIFTLWGKSRKILKQLAVGGVITCTAVFLLNGLYLRRSKGNIVWIPEFYTCGVQTTSGHLYSTGASVAQVAFDLYAILLVICNSLDLPRRSDQSIFKMLYQDKILMLVIIFFSRIASVIMGLQSSNPSLIIINIAIIHPLSAIITAWLILELQKDQEPLSSSDALDEAAFLEYEVVTESEVSSVG